MASLPTRSRLASSPRDGGQFCERSAQRDAEPSFRHLSAPRRGTRRRRGVTSAGMVTRLVHNLAHQSPTRSAEKGHSFTRIARFPCAIISSRSLRTWNVRTPSPWSRCLDKSCRLRWALVRRAPEHAPRNRVLIAQSVWAGPPRGVLVRNNLVRTRRGKLGGQRRLQIYGEKSRRGGSSCASET